VWARLRTVLGVLLADARAHRLQTATTLLGIVVGVAVAVAIRLASNAALDSFRRTYAGIAGLATHQLVAPAPLPAARLASLLDAPGVLAVQPVIETTLVLPREALAARGRQQDLYGVLDAGHPAAGDADAVGASLSTDASADAPSTLRLLGIDPMLSRPFLPGAEDVATSAEEDATRASPGGREARSTEAAALLTRLLVEPGLALVPPATLAALGLPGGGPLTVRGPRGLATLTVVPMPATLFGEVPEVAVAIADLATAQELLGLGDGVLRFDLILAPGADASAVPLLAGETIERPGRRGERADAMTAAFRFNLLALGMLALLVGAFLVFNMAQFAVVRRRPLLGKLRCLGCPARDLLLAVLLEALVLGAAGGALGLLAGRLLAGGLAGDVARTVSTLYGPVTGAPVITLDAGTAALALAIAVAATLAATLGPARSAARTPPILVAGGAVHDPPPSLRWPLALLAGAGLALLPARTSLLLPSVSVLLLLLGAAGAVPVILGRALRLAPRRPLPLLAADRLSRSLSRAGAAAGALAMPVAMTIAIVIMIGSFRNEVRAWAEGMLRGDVYVSPLFQELAPYTARLPAALLPALDATPGVASLDVRRSAEDGDPRTGQPFLVVGARVGALQQHTRLRFLQGDAAHAWPAAAAGEALVTEPLARRLSLAPGSLLELHGRGGARPVRVAAVFQDFALDRGYALLDEPAFLELYGDPGASNAALTLAPGADPEAVRAALAAAWPDAEFRSVGALRRGVLAAFDETFAITYVLQTISTVLALVGVLTALLCLHLERRAELGVLRALGATTSTVGRLLLLEALAILLVDCVVALPVGAALAWILIAVVNTRSFGWSYPMLVPAAPVANVLLLAVLAGLAAGIVPWLLVRRARVSELLEEPA